MARYKKRKLRFGLGHVLRRRRDLRPRIPSGGGRSGDRGFENGGGGRSSGGGGRSSGGGGDDGGNGFSGASCGGSERSCSRRDRDGGGGEGRSGAGQRCRRKSTGHICCRNGWARAPTLSGGAATTPDWAIWLGSFFSTRAATPLGLGRPLASRGATTPPDADQSDRGVGVRSRGIGDGGPGGGGLGGPSLIFR